MRIIIITQGISRIVEPLLNSNFKIVGVLDNLPRNFKESLPESFFIKKLKSVIRKFRNVQTLELLCKKFSVPYKVMNNSNDIGLEDWIRNLNPDIIVVYSMSSLLKRKIFSIPKYGAINLHPSFLPHYPGPNPCFWYYYNMDLKPGVTVHYIGDGEDDGDIIYQDKIEIEPGLRSKDRLDRLISNLGIKLLIRSLNEIEMGVAPRVSQSFEKSSLRARNIKLSEHSTLINWNEWQGERIWHILRGTEDWLDAIPQPNGLYKGTRWIIGSFYKSKTADYNTGKIYKIGGRHMLATKTGFISLTRKINFIVLLKNVIKIL
ncbi:methionyl-tRNA formyltransferase [Aquirufa sp. OSTEICH-129A]